MELEHTARYIRYLSEYQKKKSISVKTGTLHVVSSRCHTGNAFVIHPCTISFSSCTAVRSHRRFQSDPDVELALVLDAYCWRACAANIESRKVLQRHYENRIPDLEVEGRRRKLKF